MNPLATIRRSVPAIALVLAIAVLVSSLGVSPGRSAWLVVGAGLVAGALLAAGRLWNHQVTPPAARIKKQPKVGPHGPAAAPYDLASDQSTDTQRYLM